MEYQWLTCYAINNSLQYFASIKDVGISILFRGQPAHREAGMPCDYGVLGRCFPTHHALLGDLHQVETVLGQQVKRVGDVGNVFDVAVFETNAVQGFEEIAGGSDALDGGFEDVLGVSLCVDDQGRGIGEVGLQGAVAIKKRI